MNLARTAAHVAGPQSWAWRSAPKTVAGPGLLRRANSARAVDFLIAGAVLGVVLGIFVELYPTVHHWFIVPVYLVGVLIGVDGVRWLTGRLDAFDVAGIVGIL